VIISSIKNHDQIKIHSIFEKLETFIYTKKYM